MPVVACLHDLSKAFDLYNYDLLWRKWRKDTLVSGEGIQLPSSVTLLVSFFLEEYGLDGGVRVCRFAAFSTNIDYHVDEVF